MNWSCPNCSVQAVTRKPGVPYHRCRGMTGLSVPLVREGMKAKVVAVEREDYIGGEQVQTDGEGRPVMSVITERDDGQDCTVYAPTAGIGAKSNGMG